MDSRYISHVEKAPKRWKICIDNAFPNCEHIYPIQQHKVKEIIDAVRDNPSVKKIIVFGSSAGSNCHIGSDIDIYFDLSEDINPLNHSGFKADWEYDVFTNFIVDDRLLKEITAKGVTVYGE